MKLLGSIIVTIFFFMNVSAQDCENSKLLKEGTKWEISNFDKKERLTGINKYESISEETTANGMIWVMKTTGVDADGEEFIPESMVTIVCENGTYQMDFTEFLPTEILANLQNMEVEMENTNINFPSILDVNAKLEDATATITASTSGVSVMNLKLNITDRKIEGIETIETEAGSMKCLKITQNTIVTSGFINRSLKSTTWFLPTFGAVRTESFNQKGKLIGVSELTSLTLP
ncbi:TapB family protein [Brumimicrobium mesophilum]|uniref:TapB family protein n=1 Tax=Brumimicrobium mesophilum TaxID=392717 RepID=UPI000D1441DE|nr:hypothetical protein [Brumimicrobium mesophilum]